MRRVVEKLFKSVVLFCADILLYFCCQLSNPIGGIRRGGLAAILQIQESYQNVTM